MIKKAVIPVAGLGTRFLPITKSVAKEMLPIIDTPAIHYIVEECLESGIEEIIFITNNNKPEIKNYFTKNLDFEEKLSEEKKKLLDRTNYLINHLKFTYIIQGEKTGTGGAVSYAKDYIDDEFFAVVYGDDLMHGDVPALKQLINIHEEKNSSVIGALEISKEQLHRYGILKFDEIGRIKAIIEKPKPEDAPSNLAGLGRYIVNKKIFDVLDTLEPSACGEYYFTDAMEKLMEDNDYYACKIKGKYYDIGNKSRFIKANIDFGMEREDIKKDLDQILNSN